MCLLATQILHTFPSDRLQACMCNAVNYAEHKRQSLRDSVKCLFLLKSVPQAKSVINS